MKEHKIMINSKYGFYDIVKIEHGRNITIANYLELGHAQQHLNAIKRQN